VLIRTIVFSRREVEAHEAPLGLPRGRRRRRAVLDNVFRTVGGRYEWSYQGLRD